MARMSSNIFSQRDRAQFAIERDAGKPLDNDRSGLFRRVGVFPTHAACPLRSKSGHARTRHDMSAKCQSRSSAPQIVAVQLDEGEGVEEYAPVSALVTDEIE